MDYSPNTSHVSPVSQVTFHVMKRPVRLLMRCGDDSCSQQGGGLLNGPGADS